MLLFLRVVFGMRPTFSLGSRAWSDVVTGRRASAPLLSPRSNQKMQRAMRPGPVRRTESGLYRYRCGFGRTTMGV